MPDTRCFINKTGNELQRFWDKEVVYQSAKVGDVLPFEGGLHGRVVKIAPLDTGERL